MYEKEKQEICDVGYRIWQLGFVAANDGNISVKIDANHFLVTPTGVSKSMMTPEMIIETDGEGNVIAGDAKYHPSSEFPMHLKCYADRPDINAVVHAHPPVATAFAVSHIPLDSYIMPEAIMFLGSVPVAQYGKPSTDEVPQSVEPFLNDHDAVLLANHGALTVGHDLTTAYFRMETLEHYAKVSLNAHLLGGARELTKEQIDGCLELRKAMNIPGRHPGYKKY